MFVYTDHDVPESYRDRDLVVYSCKDFVGGDLLDIRLLH